MRDGWRGIRRSRQPIDRDDIEFPRIRPENHRRAILTGGIEKVADPHDRAPVISCRRALAPQDIAGLGIQTLYRRGTCIRSVDEAIDRDTRADALRLFLLAPQPVSRRYVAFATEAKCVRHTTTLFPSDAGVVPQYGFVLCVGMVRSIDSVLTHNRCPECASKA